MAAARRHSAVARCSSRYCEVCHGEATAKGIRSPDGASLINLTAFGADRLRQTVRSGKSAMPPFSEATISSEQLEVLTTYLADPAAAESQNAGPARPPLPHLEDVTRYTGPLGSMFRSSNGLPAISPPWAELVAYDLNEGTIKWRSPLGIVRALAAKGITNTGNAQRVHRNGPVVTAGGLIFIGTNGDGYFRAFDKDTGAMLFERALDANPEGMAAVYEVAGRQYVAFCASYYAEVADGQHRDLSGQARGAGVLRVCAAEEGDVDDARVDGTSTGADVRLKGKVRARHWRGARHRPRHRRGVCRLKARTWP